MIFFLQAAEPSHTTSQTKTYLKNTMLSCWTRRFSRERKPTADLAFRAPYTPALPPLFARHWARHELTAAAAATYSLPANRLHPYPLRKKQIEDNGLFLPKPRLLRAINLPAEEGNAGPWPACNNVKHFLEGGEALNDPCVCLFMGSKHDPSTKWRQAGSWSVCISITQSWLSGAGRSSRKSCQGTQRTGLGTRRWRNSLSYGEDMTQNGTPVQPLRPPQTVWAFPSWRERGKRQS